MFDGVCGQVHLQAGSVCVTTVTVVALVRLIFVVLPTVRLWERVIQMMVWINTLYVLISKYTLLQNLMLRKPQKCLNDLFF